jgi:hypothetical protein
MPLRVTATLGLPGSASTWTFNVVRELRLLENSPTQVESFYSDSVERAWPVIREHQHLNRSLVWKLHVPDGLWREFLSANRIPVVLSIRDPRDAMLSIMARFGETKQSAFERIALALQRIQESLRYDHVQLRYEDGFFAQPETVAALATYLGVPITQAEQARIFAAYRTERVKHLAQSLDTLPESRVRRIDTMQYDEVTQIHHVHIGDQRIGKWRERFTADERHELTASFRPFLETFGYDVD